MVEAGIYNATLADQLQRASNSGQLAQIASPQTMSERLLYLERSYGNFRSEFEKFAEMVMQKLNLLESKVG